MSTKITFPSSLSKFPITNTDPFLPQPCQRWPSLRVFAADPEDTQPGAELENPESEAARKKAEAERLRKEEQFMVISTGEAECKGCGYNYIPKNGDPEYPIAPGVKYDNLPEDWQCPVCGAEKRMFVRKELQVAGFAANQGYGLGTNSMTGDQKSLLIYGSLALFFFLFIAGYFIQ